MRRSAGAEAARLLADLVVEGARTLAFVRSRRGAESGRADHPRHLAEVAPDLARRVAAYRAGYLPEERRALEAALADGSCSGWRRPTPWSSASTSPAWTRSLLAGFPGTLASLWQQAGRAGRAGLDALVVFVARDDPLDTYLVHHPEAVFGRPVEATRPRPGQPVRARAAAVLRRGRAAAHRGRTAMFGAGRRGCRRTWSTRAAAAAGRRGWFWTLRERAADLPTSAAPAASRSAVVEAHTGRVLGTVDAGAAHAHRAPRRRLPAPGRPYLVDELDLEDGVALVDQAEPDWSTSARGTSTDIAWSSSRDERDLGDG